MRNRTIACAAFGLSLLLSSRSFAQISMTPINGPVTLGVGNATAEPLLVPKPFLHGTGDLVILKKEGDERKPLGDDFYREETGPQALSTIMLHPGDERELVIQSYNIVFPGLPPRALTLSGGAPYEPGRYQLRYLYGSGASAEFNVEPAAVRQVYVAPAPPQQKIISRET